MTLPYPDVDLPDAELVSDFTAKLKTDLLYLDSAISNVAVPSTLRSKTCRLALIDIADGGSGPQTISTATLTAISFGEAADELQNPDVMHSPDSAPSQVTVKRTGLYDLHAVAQFAPADSGICRVSIRKNGTSYIAQSDDEELSEGETRPTIVEAAADHVLLSDTDYLEMVVWQTSGANLQVLSSTLASPSGTRFEVGEIGMGGQSTAFTQLTDVPQSYAGHAKEAPVVNGAESSLTFVPIIHADGSVPLSADWNVGAKKLTNLTPGIASTDAATVGQAGFIPTAPVSHGTEVINLTGLVAGNTVTNENAITAYGTTAQMFLARVRIDWSFVAGESAFIQMNETGLRVSTDGLTTSGFVKHYFTLSSSSSGTLTWYFYVFVRGGFDRKRFSITVNSASGLSSTMTATFETLGYWTVA